ncbi:MAG: hypothetical protein F6J93_28845 [Oscillatoria sp. SIO1A7]|nr:hypothetical protein [Oscillatoria sp. SIO1A7]
MGKRGKKYLFGNPLTINSLYSNQYPTPYTLHLGCSLWDSSKEMVFIQKIC